MTNRRVLVASNRGPVTFQLDDDGHLVAARGSGGLVTALGPALQATGGLWVASAMSEADRRQAEEAPSGRMDVVTGDMKYQLRLVASEPRTYERFYNDVSNRLLWFLHHRLWDLPRQPVFGSETRSAWGAYREVNAAFAEALADEADRPSAVLVQDYHLSLVPSALRTRAPEARIAHFHHSPFAGLDDVRMLPAWMREELLAGLLGADLLGFHTRRWAESFLAACRLVPEARVDLRRGRVRWRGRIVRVGAYPIGVDAATLRERASTPIVAEKRRALRQRLGDRLLVLRVDRTELSKNVLRGFLAFEDLMRRYPAWRGRVLFLALLNPSRQGLAEYRAYTEECVRAAERINESLGSADWMPIELQVNDDYPEVLAAYGVYDVLMVNPVMDGMNLVAKEGPLLNRRSGTLVLSTNAGAYEALGRHAIPAEPLDVAGTADALDAALGMPPEERGRRARALRRAAGAPTPAAWVQRQLRDLERD